MYIFCKKVPSPTLFLRVPIICTLDFRGVRVCRIVLLVWVNHFVGVVMFSLVHLTTREEIPAEAFVDSDVCFALDDSLFTVFLLRNSFNMDAFPTANAFNLFSRSKSIFSKSLNLLKYI